MRTEEHKHSILHPEEQSILHPMEQSIPHPREQSLSLLFWRWSLARLSSSRVNSSREFPSVGSFHVFLYVFINVLSGEGGEVPSGHLSNLPVFGNFPGLL